MKRFISVLTLILCLSLLAACGVEEVLDEFAGQLAASSAEDTAAADPAGLAAEEPFAVAEATASDTAETSGNNDFQPASDTDTVPAEDAGQDGSAPTEQEQEPEAGSDSQNVDFTALSVGECVEDAWPEANVLPGITLDCAGAETINGQIQAQFAVLADDPMCDVHYEVYKGAGRVLSVLMVQQVNDSAWYTPFNLDLATGQVLSGAGLLSIIGQDEADLRELELALLGKEFTYQYGGMQADDGEFYDQQYDRTTDPSNADTQRVWFGDMGQLYFVGRIYAMAGAEYYEYMIGTGMYF